MNTEGSGEDSLTRDINRVQMTLVAQLFQAVTTMHHVDELLQWLAYAIVQRFNVQLAQFWTNQMHQSGRLVVILRTIVRQDISLPEQVVVNDYVASVAQRVISERRSYRLQSIETIFPSFQTTLLKRYGLNYCGACFTSGNFLLPPSEGMFSDERPPVPLSMMTLLLCKQLPPPDLLPAIAMLLDQAIAIAANRGLLLPTGGQVRPQAMPQYSPQSFQNTPQPTPQFFQPTPMPFQNVPQPTPFQNVQQPTPHPFQNVQQPTPMPFSQEAPLTLEQLIPRRRQDADLLLSDNPFANAAVISDKRARRLHAAIDGHANIADLCGITGMSIKEVHIALQRLLEQHRIELYEPNGQLVRVPPAL